MRWRSCDVVTGPGRRAGTWSRQQARRLHLEFVRDRWPLIAGLAGLIVAATAVAVVATPGRFRGFVAGVGVSTAFWYVVLFAVQVAGTTSYMLGSQGEEWTSDALRKLLRRGWRVIEHVPLQKGDIDHALIGPGGAYAIETKATYGEWNLDDPDEWLLRAASQARHRAERLRALLRSRDCDVRTDVRPLLVLWGPLVGTAPRIDGIDVVHGTNLRSWREQLGTGTLSSEDVERAAAGLEGYVAMRDSYIRTKEGALPLVIELGPFGIFGQVSTGLLGALVALLTFGLAARVTPSSAFVPLLAATAVMGVGAMRVQRLRLLALGWLTFAVALALVVAVAVVVELIG